VRSSLIAALAHVEGSSAFRAAIDQNGHPWPYFSQQPFETGATNSASTICRFGDHG
jgi:hypothetical protein